jgi:CHAT domain-containing protein/tetratricopeptide (TPR) repeat protein
LLFLIARGDVVGSKARSRTDSRRALNQEIGKPLSRQVAYSLGIAISLGAMFLATPDGGNESEAISAARARLATEFGRRPAAGRVLGFAYDVLRPPGPPLGEPEGLEGEIADLRAESDHHPSATVLADLGIAYLLNGDLERAIVKLQRAQQWAPNDPRVASDLAALYLTRARRDGDLHQSFLAFASARRACQLDHDLKPAQFNLAMASEALHLESAAAAWSRYLEMDPRSGWSREARSHLVALAIPTSIELWSARQRQIEDAAAHGRQARVDALVKRDPQSARERAEELLGEWAGAVRAGRELEARGSLGVARSIGSALARLSGESMIADAVRAIDSARDGAEGERRYDDLVEGHWSYRRGLELHGETSFGPARALMQRARSRLARGGSPYAAWAAYQIALEAYQDPYQDPKYSHALEDLDRLLVGLSSFSALRGSAHKLRGLIETVSGDPVTGLADYMAAVEIFERLGEEGNAAEAHALTAGALGSIGEDVTHLWRHLASALGEGSRFGGAHAKYLVYERAAIVAESEGEWRIGIDFRGVVVHAAELTRLPHVIAEALKGRALSYRVLGDYRSALADLHQAQSCSSELKDKGLQSEVKSDILFVQGAVDRLIAPRRAIDPLNEAVRAFRATEYRFLLALSLLERGRLESDLGELDLAGKDFSAAVEECELQRQIRPEQDRMAFLDQVHEIYEEAAIFEADRRGDAAQALDYLERGRSRLLLDWMTSTPVDGSARVAEAAPYRSEALSAALPAGLAIVEYAAIHGHLLAWVVAGKNPVFKDLGSDDRAARLAQQMAGSIEVDDKTFQTASAELYSMLIAPLSSALRGVTEIAFVPGALLGQVPFAALFDAARGRYLVEDRAVAVAPSATLFVRALRQGESRLGTTGALVVSEPAIETARFAGLAPLPGAAEEAKIVTSLLPGALVLDGPRATKGEFLRRAAAYGLIHFAGHSILNARSPLLSELLFAPGANGSDDGVLRGRDILGQRFDRTRLVVLSACDTARGDGLHDEELSFAQLFLAAGVPAVLAHRWAVSDQVSASFFGGFYRSLQAGHDSLSALAAAQREFLRPEVPDRRRPGAWAGFELIGAPIKVVNP